ncbi:MAG: translation initiation factor IF-2 [Clostridia bacterium]|nr:translation initiation factor IF-2 [Clostridia bacterium]
MLEKLKSCKKNVEKTVAELENVRIKFLERISKKEEKTVQVEEKVVEETKQEEIVVSKKTNPVVDVDIKEEVQLDANESVSEITEEKTDVVEEKPVEKKEPLKAEEKPKKEKVERVKKGDDKIIAALNKAKTGTAPVRSTDSSFRTYIPQQERRSSTSQKAQSGDKYQQNGGRAQITQRNKPVESIVSVMPANTGKTNNYNKKKDNRVDSGEKKSGINKRTLIRKGFIEDELIEEDRNGTRRYRMGKKVKTNQFTPAPVVIEKAVITTENLTVKMLSEKIGKTAADIVKQLFNLGIISNINGNIDFDTAELIAAEYGIELELKLEQTYEEVLKNIHEDDADNAEDLVVRPPVVTIMGHVDHGKTSLLDYIRKADVAGGEAGGITQHIGAYTVSLKGAPITFLDTPGHEAFTSMRERGAQVTDIAVIVVAADDGIMPQTVEAINHSKAANVPIIVAVNKMDKQGATPDKIMQQLTEYEILPEEWGGDTIVVPVSAKTGMGVEKLLESILLLAEIKELKANPNRSARGSIIEAKLDKGRGPLATVLVQNGTLRVSDFVVAGTAVGRIRAMIDDKGRNVKEAGPSVPVSVLGFSEVPNAGDQLMVVADEKLSKQVAEERKNKEKVEKAKSMAKFTLEEAFGKIGDGDVKELNLIVKADVQGSVEAIKQSVIKLSNEEVKVNIIHGAVGAVNESDIILASSSHATIIGFNVRPDSNAKSIAEKKGIAIRTYRIIYDLIDDVSAAMKGMLAPKFSENVLGHAEVRATFKITGVGTIAGSYVTDGKITRNSKLRLLRDNIIIYEGAVGSLKRLKDDVKEVATGYECGIGIEGYNDLKEGDVIEAFILEQQEV